MSDERPRLMDAHTGEFLRFATDDEVWASENAGPDGEFLLAEDGTILEEGDPGADDATRVFVEEA